MRLGKVTWLAREYARNPMRFQIRISRLKVKCNACESIHVARHLVLPPLVWNYSIVVLWLLKSDWLMKCLWFRHFQGPFANEPQINISFLFLDVSADSIFVLDFTLALHTITDQIYSLLPGVGCHFDNNNAANRWSTDLSTDIEVIRNGLCCFANGEVSTENLFHPCRVALLFFFGISWEWHVH